MIRMLLEPEAEREFQEAQVWYEKHNVALATMFREAVRETLTTIEEDPERFPIAKRDIRKARVRKFPYVVYFVKTAEWAVVIAIIHGRRNPKRWQARR